MEGNKKRSQCNRRRNQYPKKGYRRFRARVVFEGLISVNLHLNGNRGEHGDSKNE